MRTRRVRVRRERPTALAWAAALAVTMLMVYLATLDAGRPDVVESMSPAPRVTREIAFDKLQGWCVSLCRAKARDEARIRASGFTARGAAGSVVQIDDAWHVIGAVYDDERDAERIAKRLRDEEDIDAQVLLMAAERLDLRITAPERQIDCVAGADALLRAQTRQLGDIALQLDRGEIRPDAARTLCAVAATEAADAGKALSAIPGAEDSRLCAALIEQTGDLADALRAIADSRETSAVALSGMLRCAQIETFLRQRDAQAAMVN